MGNIILSKLGFSSLPDGMQYASVEYRLASSVGNFELVSQSAPVLRNGNFAPALEIPDLINGQEYTVKATLNCGSSPFLYNFVVGESCTGYTVQGGVDGGRVAWVRCNDGTNDFLDLAFQQQATICARAPYSIASGSIDLISNNGTCAEGAA